MHSIEALRHIVNEMQASAKRVLEYSRNKSVTGLHRERIVEAYLQRITPKAFEIGSGFLYGKEKSSKQVDLIIYDHLNFAPLFDEGGYKVVLPQSVIHAIEVKSFLDKSALFDALDNIQSVTEINPKVQGIIFAFDGLSLDKTFDHIESYTSRITDGTKIAFRMPQMIVNLEKWLIVGRHDSDDGSSLTYISATEQPFEEQFLYFFAQIYHSLYGYRRKLYPHGVLPTLEEQGFPINFEVGGTKYLTLRKKTAD